MNYRRWAQVAEWSLLAVMLLVHVALLWGRQRWLAESFGQLGIVLADAVPFAQAGLFAFWAAAGPGRFWLRLLCTVPLAAPSAYWWWGDWDYGTDNFVLRLLGGAALLVGTFGVALVCFGLRLRRSDRPDDVSGSQFSIRTLFIATTLIAIAIGAAETLRPHLSIDYGNFWTGTSNWSRLGLVVAEVGSISVVALWAMLRPGAVWLRLVALAIVAPVTGWYVSSLMSSPWTESITWVAWNTMIVLVIGGSLVPIRLLNYRLCRRAAVVVIQTKTDAVPTVNSMRKSVAAIVVFLIGLASCFGLAPLVRQSPLPQTRRPTNTMAEWVYPGSTVIWYLCPTTPAPLPPQVFLCPSHPSPSLPTPATLEGETAIP
jgi:hypothetical protein